MAFERDQPLDLPWKEYGLAFGEFDDLTLARWLAQTLGQLEGKAWRASHPLLGTYRMRISLRTPRSNNSTPSSSSSFLMPRLKRWLADMAGVSRTAKMLVLGNGNNVAEFGQGSW